MGDFIKLIGVGLVPAKKAIDFQVGDYIIWNYGDRGKILDRKVSTMNHNVRFLVSAGGMQKAMTYDLNQTLGDGNFKKA